MTGRAPHRLLVCEPLEQRSLPSSLLLVFAPLGDDVHAVVEKSGWFAPTPENAISSRHATAPWKYHHSNPDLLLFVEEHTAGQHDELPTEQWPTEHQCRTADEMMKLEDSELRAMVAASGEWLVAGDEWLERSVNADREKSTGSCQLTG